MPNFTGKSLNAYKNILVIQTAFIGDAILASSVIEKLHAFFPEAKVSIVVRKGNESIYSQHPFLHEVLVWDKTGSKNKNLFRLLVRIRKNKYDCVINCHRFASSGILTAFSGAKHKAGYKETPFSYLFDTTARHQIGNGRHETQRYNDLIEDFTDAAVFKPKLYPSATDYEKIRNFHQAPYVCMAPASVWFTKQLPKEKWIELCNKNNGAKVYLLGGPGDKQLCNEIKSASSHSNIEVLAGELSLLQSAALMQHAKMNYVNDSGPLHLASSMNAPVTAFFCSTVPAFGFGPLSDESKVVEVKGLDCKPCNLHGFKACPKAHFKCGREMNLDL